MYNDSIFELEETEIEMTNQHKFLGIIFDKKNLHSFPT